MIHFAGKPLELIIPGYCPETIPSLLLTCPPQSNTQDYLRYLIQMALPEDLLEKADLLNVFDEQPLSVYGSIVTFCFLYIRVPLPKPYTLLLLLSSSVPNFY